ncbi:MAG TPA: type II toxin-antitoxin system HipA family toxin [Verrucomicrobiae bacterium]|nr:type II toxin-antitoxin system HipA family toxin [Verrucomicrobiae bacterium]
MPRKRQHTPLRVLLNNHLVGRLLKEPGGAISFRYDEKWLSSDSAIPVSLSLPLREDAFKGEPVVAVFENLLPDSDVLRRRIAERVGAKGTDAYSLLSQIGRDCVGALQFVPEDDDAIDGTAAVAGEIVSENDIEKLLNDLAQAPLGLDRDQDFRISVAGAQEKTALLRHKGKWLKPHGTTPTTHIFKPQIGTLQNGIDLSNSVENEYYCLKLLAAFGLPVNAAEMQTFGKTKALVVERFDRKRTTDGRLLRVPQEDACQALSCPPTQKYQNQGGPGMVDILNLLKGGDTPAEDQKTFLKAQILFWLIGATDGHAKNFSIFLGPRGRFHLTPLYDVLTAQPSLDDRQIERKQMKLAMSVGTSRHYKIEDISGRHFIQTAERSGLPGVLASEALAEVAKAADGAMKSIEKQLPRSFPHKIHISVMAALSSRLRRI